ncbi:MAG: hypothetical protein A2142_02450 [candidate division Zixibacteria bacterium RBG_16_48_11]|nr:MAG: hypothetical protein A2142_02450 [candidate division Zixibacteria bacterium RBG_16_48_11]
MHPKGLGLVTSFLVGGDHSPPPFNLAEEKILGYGDTAGKKDIFGKAGVRQKLSNKFWSSLG